MTLIHDPRYMYIDAEEYSSIYIFITLGSSIKCHTIHTCSSFTAWSLSCQCTCTHAPPHRRGWRPLVLHQRQDRRWHRLQQSAAIKWVCGKYSELIIILNNECQTFKLKVSLLFGSVFSV